MMQLCVFLFSTLLCACLADTIIPRPPTMVRQPPYEQLFQVPETQDETDKSFALDCEAHGNPEPTYRWLKDGEPFDYKAEEDSLHKRSQKGTLYVNNPLDSDEGIYQCFAENTFGTSVSNTVHLRKEELNSFPLEEPKEVLVMEGEPLSLNCNAPSGYPKPTIFWILQYNSGALSSINSSRMTVDPDGQLHFTKVTQSDVVIDAHYTCTVTSMISNQYRLGNKIVLRVEDSGSSGANNYPLTKQYVSPSNVNALRGQKLELSCIYGGTPVPSIVWTKNGRILQSSKRVAYINYGKTVKIVNVDFQDEGTYECTASNGVGAPSSQSMVVAVQAAPYWINVSNDTNAAEDEAVSFKCEASGIPVPDIEWYMNGVPLKDAKPNPKRRLDKVANVLVMDGLRKTDTAVFQCNASNIYGYIFRNFYLNVLDLPPNIIEKPDAVTRAVLSSTVTLRCRVSDSPSLQVTWLRENREVVGGRFQIRDGDLVISNATTRDEGHYTCYATNKLGSDEVSTRLELKKKTIINIPPEDLEIHAGRLATFRCGADADPSFQLDIEWLFNGHLIDFDIPRMLKTTEGSLTIMRTSELDSGVYTCVAKTEADQDEATAFLIVQDIPNPPTIVNVQCDGLTALVAWQPNGDNRAPIISYTLQYNTSFNPDMWESIRDYIPSTNLGYTVSLTPWANYSFRVIAGNKIGPSLPSRYSKVCETPANVTYKNPDNVVGTGTEKDNLVISWTAMPMIEHHAPGFLYKVFWKRDDISGASWQTSEITDWEKNSFIIPNQPTFTRYRIKVEAHNSKGQSNYAATEVTGYSGSDVPLEYPRNFKLLYMKDSRSAVLSWDPVPEDSVRGHFRGYKIQTWTVDEGEDRLREHRERPFSTQALVTSFRPFTRNFVRILAFNDKYNGPVSHLLEFTTPEDTPGPVAYFNAMPLDSTSFSLQWKRPLEPNGLLTGYHIYYSELSGTELGEAKERIPKITDPRETRAELGGLKPDIKYRIVITATTSKGEGEKMYIEVKTNNQAKQRFITVADPTSHVTEKDLRRHLFKDYDKLVRPVKNPKTPVWASVSITPIVLREVDVEHHAMTLDSWLTVAWKDEDLRWSSEEFGGIKFLNLPLSEVWSPDLSVHTGNSDSHHLPSVTTNVIIRSDGEMQWVPPFSIHNRCPRFAPGTDRLECTISIMSWTYDFTQLDLQIHSKANESRIYFEDTHPVWKLEDMSITREKLMFNCCPEPYPTIHFNIVLQKREGH